MTDPQFTQLMATAISIATLIVSVFNGRRSSRTAGKVDEIKVNTDGNMTKLSNKLDLALEEIAGQKKLIAEMTESKARHRTDVEKEHQREVARQAALKSAEVAPADPEVP